MKTRLLFLFIICTQMLTGQDFTEVRRFIPLEGAFGGSVTFTDTDGDSDPDLLITGENNSGERTPALYLNDGGNAKLYINETTVSVADTEIENTSTIVPFPNPSDAGMLNIPYNTTENGRVSVKLFNLNGILLKKLTVSVTRGTQVLPVNIASLPEGNYVAELNDGSRILTAKFVVQ